MDQSPFLNMKTKKKGFIFKTQILTRGTNTGPPPGPYKPPGIEITLATPGSRPPKRKTSAPPFAPPPPAPPRRGDPPGPANRVGWAPPLLFPHPGGGPSPKNSTFFKIPYNVIVFWIRFFSINRGFLKTSQPLISIFMLPQNKRGQILP